MVLNRVCFAALGVMVLVWSGLSAAQQYRPNEFLNLDLSRAVLSPKPLGPAASFSPGPLDVTIDRGKDAAPASAELMVDPKTVATATVHAESNSTPRNSTPKNATSKYSASKNSTSKTAIRTAASSMRGARVRAADRSAPHKPRALVALHGRNPVEAQARDTNVQVWPCRSGGICNWKR
jgi:cytoskeletal protein RodZ